MDVLAPFAGTVVALASCPDPLFAEGMLGHGVGIMPPDTEPFEVRSPVDGAVTAHQAHAVVVTGETGSVLVHLGLDTHAQRGAGFEAHVGVGETVTAGQVLLTWDPRKTLAAGASVLCPVVVLESGPERLVDVAADGAAVGPGDLLMRVPANA